MSTNSDYKRITDKLNNFKNSHPNFYSMWSQYLRIKTESLIADFDTCEKNLERLKDKPDLTNDHLVTLLILNNSYHLNRNDY